MPLSFLIIIALALGYFIALALSLGITIALALKHIIALALSFENAPALAAASIIIALALAAKSANELNKNIALAL